MSDADSTIDGLVSPGSTATGAGTSMGEEVATEPPTDEGDTSVS